MRRTLGRVAFWFALALGGVFGLLFATLVVLVAADVANLYRVPSSAMEPTLHCARPATGCEAGMSDRFLTLELGSWDRGDVVAFATPPAAVERCGSGGTFVKRIIGLPGETLAFRLENGAAFVYIDGERLDEPYIELDRRDSGPAETFRVPAGRYFMLGDNRSQSCDSRVFGAVPSGNLIGRRVLTYWPPGRISIS